MDFAKPKTGPAQPDGINELILPYVPANVRPDGRYKATEITSDVYHVAEQLSELNPRLVVNCTTDTATGQYAFTIVEQNVPTPTGPVDQVVFRCNALDSRVVEHVRYLLHVPFDKRFAEAERIAAKHEADSAENESEMLVEKIGLPMLRDLRECGFLGEYGAGPGSDLRRSRRKFGRG